MSTGKKDEALTRFEAASISLEVLQMIDDRLRGAAQKNATARLILSQALLYVSGGNSAILSAK